MFAHDVGRNEYNQPDTRLDMEEVPNSTELSPLLRPSQKPEEPSSNAMAITSLSSDIWMVILRYLDVSAIHNLRRANGILRRNINRALQHDPHHEQQLVMLIALLKQAKSDFSLATSKERKRKKCRLVLAEIALAGTACILSASLPINSFQTTYVSTYKNISQQIVNTGMVNITFAKDNFGWCYIKNAVWNLPAQCNIGCNIENIIDGPAGYWFTAFITANAAYLTARVASRIPYEKYPISKITTGLAAISLGGLTITLPLIASLGWAESSAYEAACCIARKCTLKHIVFPPVKTCEIGTQIGYAVQSFCVNGTSIVSPWIPALAEISPLIIPSIVVGGMIAIGFWAYKQNRAHAALETALENDEDFVTELTNRK